MNKTIIEVPEGVRYLSTWQNFDLPQGPCIFNKKMPGCGFTEWVLWNSYDSTLVGPRKTLLGNKAEQHPGDVFYVINDFEQTLKIDDDINSITKRSVGQGLNYYKVVDPKVAEKKAKIIDKLKKEFFIKLVKNLMNYIVDRHSKGLPAKILVTYDSFGLVYSILRYNNLFDQFKFYIDEFQSIFVDSKFKSTTEIKFVSNLLQCTNVYYASATPMMEEYLDQLDYFKDLPYYELDWETRQPGRIVKPDLKVLVSKSVITTANEIIDKYKSGNFEYAVSPVTGQIIYSKEAVIYVNSVKNIINIVKKSGLRPADCNILCANTEDNARKIRCKLGKRFIIGKVPLRGEPRKMFTFCTRTVYLGADFYSDNARSFILSDANLDTLAVDISLDLPQILGRQRLDENPWKNKATFYYKPLANGKNLTKDDFDKSVSDKLKLSNTLLRVYDNSLSVNDNEAADSYTNLLETTANILRYTKNFVAVDNIYDDNGKILKKIPVINNLVMISEQRAYDIQQIDYKDRFSVFSSVNSVMDKSPVNGVVEDFFNGYITNTKLSDKLKYLCTYLFKNQEEIDSVLNNITEHHFVDYYRFLGPDKCRSLGYNITLLNKEIGIQVFDKTNLESTIKNEFELGKAYSKLYIKEKLSNIYANSGYNKLAKASDLKEWFSLRETFILIKDDSGNKKKVPAFKILK